jgi:hypothetical protein
MAKAKHSDSVGDSPNCYLCDGIDDVRVVAYGGGTHIEFPESDFAIDLGYGERP